MVSCMNEPPNRYDVTVTVARDGGRLPDPVGLEYANSAVTCYFSQERMAVRRRSGTGL